MYPAYYHLGSMPHYFNGQGWHFLPLSPFLEYQREKPFGPLPGMPMHLLMPTHYTHLYGAEMGSISRSSEFRCRHSVSRSLPLKSPHSDLIYSIPIGVWIAVVKESALAWSPCQAQYSSFSFKVTTPKQTERQKTHLN